MYISATATEEIQRSSKIIEQTRTSSTTWEPPVIKLVPNIGLSWPPSGRRTLDSPITGRAKVLPTSTLKSVSFVLRSVPLKADANK